MLIQGQVGAPGASSAPNANPTVRMGALNDLIVSELQGRYYESVYRGQVYTMSTAAAGVNVSAQAISPCSAGGTALMCLYNPLGNLFNAVILRAGLATVSGTPGGPVAYNVIPSTTITAAANLTPVNNKTFNASGSSMKGFSNTALTGSVIATMLRTLGGQAAIAVGAGINSVMEEVAGDIILVPGAALILAPVAAGTTHTASCFLTWAEMAI